MDNLYLVVAPVEFYSTLRPLIEQKVARGYDVSLYTKPPASFASSYEQLRQYVLRSSPACLLLVGDHNKVPGYPLGTNERYQSDAYFSMQDNDVCPRVPTGRLSVNTEAELAAMIDRLVRYPADPGFAWRRRAVLSGFLPYFEASADPDNPGWNFVKENESYFDPVYRFPPDSDDPRAIERWQASGMTKAHLVAAINEGASIVRYVGHGLQCGWASAPPEHAPSAPGDPRSGWFQTSDLDLLDVGGRLPFVVSAACYTGEIASTQSFAEEWMLRGKAIAVFAGDIITSVYWNDRITQQIVHQIVTNDLDKIGEIVLRAMRRMYSIYGDVNDFNKDTYRRYRLLGDPDTRLAQPDTVARPVTKEAEMYLEVGTSGIHGSARVRFDSRVRRAQATLRGLPPRPPILRDQLHPSTKIYGNEVEATIHGPRLTFPTTARVKVKVLVEALVDL